MRKFNALAIVIACLAGVGVFTCQVRPWHLYEGCGRSRDFLNELNLLSRHSHSCTSCILVHELWTIEAAQEVYRIEHGQYAASLAELNLNEVPDPEIFRFRTKGSDWYIEVEKSDRFAGNYLLTSDGRLYFSPTAPATQSDIVLRD